ncbi:MAG: tRNA (N6-threonylcarbamoyladenosine(37)-N6)-methyltransferase TrmO [Ghiorsea sp.]|nr:tRNA (N6-threonylcarbamoyladenosine(37)-N6)-methyltransferase TrmO [Ghiorsea sp.]
MSEDWRNPQHSKQVKSYTTDKQQNISSMFELQGIGVVASPYQERFATPRQPAYALEDKPATITLHAGQNFEQALQDLDTFSHVWVIYWMHLNQGWNPLVKPPRDPKNKHGVLSTRAPHRPNSIGLSVVPLLSVKGRVLHIGNHDMLDGTPVLDIKPYIPESDCMQDANAGWLDKL